MRRLKRLEFILCITNARNYQTAARKYSRMRAKKGDRVCIASRSNAERLHTDWVTQLDTICM